MSDAFENSIRNKLNEADFPFDQDAWSKMESLLDAPQEKKRVIGWWWWLIGLLILGTSAWFIISRTNGTLAANPDTFLVSLPGKTDPTPKKIQPQPDNSASVTTTRTLPPQLSKSTTLPAPIATTGAYTGQLPVPKKAVNTTIPAEKNNAPNKDRSLNNAAPDIVRDNNATSLNTSPQTGFISICNVNNYYGYTKIDESIEMPVSKEIQTIQPDNKTPAKKAVQKENKWFIGLMFGPDINVAPSFKYGNTGFNIGAQLHYYFSKKLFITTGLVYSKKLYTASPNDYKGWTNTAYPYGPLLNVTANCDILDLPVNLNYTFLRINKSMLSATVGMSNYFMLREQYEYNYQYICKEKVVQNENRHYLAILNVGALYQYHAGRRLVIGVQPYAKIPLHGVGYGQVKLYSAGVSLQVMLTGKKH